MNRRGFLTGAFKGIAAGGLIIGASSSDLELFGKEMKEGEIVSINQSEPAFPQLGHFVFDSTGKPLGIVTQYDLYHDRPVDITAFGDSFSKTVDHLTKKLYFTVQCYGPVMMKIGEK